MGLNEETALALYRRDVESTASTPITNTPKRLKKNRNWKQYIFTPRFLSALVLAVGLLFGSLYATWQWISLSQPPSLTVTAPQAQEILTSPVRVSGTTSADNTVTINTEIVAVDINGNFGYDLALPPGERAIVVTAEDSRGRRSEEILFVTVE
ncbi:hypothetical protein LRY60_02615 [Candidatus Woesebacteria bacterium]|nr:hypothetical protein [Candidatus Woesebacteria bacterium]